MPRDDVPAQQLLAIDGTVDRRRHLVEAARHRRVVHLGCVDERLTRQRLAEGRLLHADLAEVATSLLGVDISRDGIRLLEQHVPGSYLVADVEQIDQADLPVDAELVIASEIIEHLANPGAFLRGLRRYLATTGAHAIITTPNAFGWVAFLKMAVRRREPSHPDHLVLFSPFTLVQSVERAGLSIEGFWMHDWARGGGISERLRNAATSVVRRWNPYLAVGLIVRVSVRP